MYFSLVYMTYLDHVLTNDNSRRNDVWILRDGQITIPPCLECAVEIIFEVIQTTTEDYENNSHVQRKS